MNFQKTYNKIFNRELSVLGFSKIKELKIWGKLVNDELLHYIMQTPALPLQRSIQGFSTCIGVQSVYCKEISSYNLESEKIDLLTISQIYFSNNSLDYSTFNRYYYQKNNFEKVIEKAVDDCLKYGIPSISHITSLLAFIELCKEVNWNTLKNVDRMYGNSLILIKAGYTGSFDDLYLRFQEQNLAHYGGDANDPSYIRDIKLVHHALYDSIATPRDTVMNDPQLYAAAMAEAERRKTANLRYLKSLGLVST